MSPIMSAILNRRSIRSYTLEKVKLSDVAKILTAASWAPSGKNLQPWRFSVIANNTELIHKLAALTSCDPWLKHAPCLIAVFFDSTVLKNPENSTDKVYSKHMQAIGAAVQNMMLAAHEIGLGTCWVSEIITQEMKVKEFLNVSAEFDLLALIAVGHPKKQELKSKRRELSKNIINWL
ncbi:Nitroreductase [Propionispira arboris]|uniref:Nitroreductase n=1 Tax=Propionispira arboris TaxID=84035 RepID=A0A1H6VYL5_9FIRM|nr:nitroreductase family protein [Propionispira arboris]SEJ09761.1 Nitroreductase [Propionispira arboris]